MVGIVTYFLRTLQRPPRHLEKVSTKTSTTMEISAVASQMSIGDADFAERLAEGHRPGAALLSPSTDFFFELKLFYKYPL